jgi:heme A synthase
LSVEFGASFESLRLAYLLLSVMVTLALLGAAYVAWDADEWSSAAGWTLVAFIGVGLVYVSVVRGDLMSERAQSAAAIEEQPLADLHEAERYVAAKLSDPVNARG